MAYDKEKYKYLKQFGYSAKDAHTFASLGKKKYKMLIEDKILNKIEAGEKLTVKYKRDAARFFGFTAKEADRIRGFNAKNFYETIKEKAIPEVGELALKRMKDNIPLKAALANHVLIHKARYGKTMYMYQVEYRVLSEVAFFRDKKFVTVVSPKKLSKKQVYQKVLNEIFPRHDEDYGTAPDPTSLKIVNAYYMTNAQYKALNKDRENKK